MPGYWDWTRSNGGASAAQTVKAHTAVSNKGRTYDFSHFVWNDLVENTYTLLLQNDREWDDRILSYDDTLIEADGILTADRFNSLRINIRDTGWFWQYNDTREDYLGRYNVHPGDKVFGSYILELAHKYNVMHGIFDGTAGDDIQISSVTNVGIPTDLYMICVRGILTGMLLDTEIKASTAVDLYPLIPELIAAAVRTEIETDTDADCNIVLFGICGINASVKEDATGSLDVIPVRTPPRQVIEGLQLKTSERIGMDDESSDDMEMICSDVLGITGAVLKLTRMRAYPVTGGVWRSNVASKSVFGTIVIRSILTSVALMRSEVSTRSAFSVTTARAVRSYLPRELRSDLRTESDFSGWWCNTIPHRIDRMRSEIESEAEFILTKCTEILLRGYTLSSDVESRFICDMAVTRGLLSGTGDYRSEISGSSQMTLVTRQPLIMDEFEGSSDIRSDMTAGALTAGALGVRLEPYTSRIDSSWTAAMGSEAELRFNAPLSSDLTSVYVFRLTGVFSFTAEYGSDISSAEAFSGGSANVQSGVSGDAENMTVSSTIVMTASTAWIYPVQTSDDLYVEQAKEIAASGTGLTLG